MHLRLQSLIISLILACSIIANKTIKFNITNDLTNMKANRLDIKYLEGWGLEVYESTLTTLDLSFNRISNINLLKKFRNLTNLNLVNNKIRDLTPLAGLSNLIELRVGSNFIKNLDPIEQLIKLTHLQIDNNAIRSLGSLFKLPFLSSLTASDNYLDNMIIEHGHFTNLKHLDLSRNKIKIFEIRTNLKRLESILLNHNPIEKIYFIDLYDFKSVKILRLDQIYINPLTSIVNMPRYLSEFFFAHNSLNNLNDLDIKFSISLNHLILADNKIVEFNLENLTNLIYLDLSKNLIEHLNVNIFSQLKQLYYLDLSNNLIKNVDSLKMLTDLSQLKLSYNQIDNLNGLTNLTKMEFLYANSNRLKNVEQIGNLYKLSYLNLSDNQIEQLNWIKKLSLLQNLDLSHNNLHNLKQTNIDLLNINLIQLDLSFNKLKTIDFIRYFSKLSKLVANQNEIEDLNELRNLSLLESLLLNENKINNLEPLSNLTKLKNLEMNNNNIENIQHLIKLNKISNLKLKNNKIRQIPNGFFDSLNKLIMLYLGSNRITQIDQIVSLNDLNILDLSNNEIESLFLTDASYIRLIFINDNINSTLKRFQFNFYEHLIKFDASFIKNIEINAQSVTKENLNLIFIDETKINSIQNITNQRILMNKNIEYSFIYYKSLFVLIKNDLNYVNCYIQIELVKRNKIHLNLYYPFQVENFLNICQNYFDF